MEKNLSSSILPNPGLNDIRRDERSGVHNVYAQRATTYQLKNEFGIKNKVRLYFLIFAMLIACCFGLFFQNIRATNTIYNYFINRDVLVAHQVTKLSSSVYEYRALQNYHKDSVMSQDMNLFEKKLEDKEKFISSSFNELEELLKDTTREEEVFSTHQLWVDYLNQSSNLLQYSQKNNWEDANNIMLKESLDSFDKLTASLETMNQNNWDYTLNSATNFYQFFEKENHKLTIIFAGMIFIAFLIIINVENMISKLSKLTNSFNSMEKGSENLNHFRDFTTTFFKNISGSIAHLINKSDQIYINAENNLLKEKLLHSEASQSVHNICVAAEAVGSFSQAADEIGEQIRHSNQLTNSAISEANEADSTVKHLLQASDKIGEVVNLIYTITEQMNLLAFNATLEAARAGEAGKGFAVVASEMKNLTIQAVATSEKVAKQVYKLQKTSQDTSKGINNIFDKIQQVNHISTSIITIVEKQNTTRGEISNNLQQAALTNQKVSEVVDDVLSITNETIETIKEINSSSSQISIDIETLKRNIEDLLDSEGEEEMEV